MNVDLFPIMDNEGSEIAISGEVTTSDNNLTAVSHVSGRAINAFGRIKLEADVSSVLTTVCSRCLSPVTENLTFHISEVIGEDVTLDGTALNVDSVTMMYLFMHMPIQFYCRDDCKGLCAECGANLNNETCNCMVGEIDERLAALKKLLDR